MGEMTRRRLRGRRELFRLAVLGLGSVAVACGGRGGGDSQEGRSAEGRPTTAAERGTGTPEAATPPTPVAVVGEPQCLVTKTRGVPAGYIPQDLVLLPARVRAVDGILLRQQAADAVVRLVDGAAREGHALFVLSGFRSYQEQERILRDEVAQFGKAAAEKQVAQPGHSEHQLGLAADITSNRSPYELTERFGTWPEGRWLAENAARFGYVLSYPQGKEAVTGYIYEPWHIRYVGLPLSESVSASGLTLTEFLPKHNLVGECP